MSKMDDLLTDEGNAAETVPTPTGGTRRNQGRSVMFSIRLGPDELDALQHHADARGLPARTLARAWILQTMQNQDSLDQRVERLEKAVFTRTA